MNLDAQKIVNAITAQRNSAFDSAAQLAAMVETLQEENAKLRAQLDAKDAPAPD